MIQKVLLLSALLCLALGVATAMAEPVLQLYIEGATYDTSTETWVTNSSSFRLWVIGNITGGGGAGEITDVHLAVAFMTSENTGGAGVTLTPTTAGGAAMSYGSAPNGPYTDTSTPGAPTFDFLMRLGGRRLALTSPLRGGSTDIAASFPAG